MYLRIIRDSAHSALFNMQADLFLLDLAARSGAFILRTYTWTAPTISLGCMQHAAGLLDADAMRSAGVETATRPTGGRAVLHWNDVTYSCAFPVGNPLLGRSIAETYAIISRCLAAGLLGAGIDCGLHDSDAEQHSTHRNLRLPCFLSPNRSELMAGGRKLMGSAQRRTSQAVLQHGSIPLDGSFRRVGEFMAVSSDERDSLRKLLERKCTCAREVVPSLDSETLARCMIRGFTEALPFEAFEKGWDEAELRKIGEESGSD